MKPARASWIEARRHGACVVLRGVALKRHNTAQPEAVRLVRGAFAGRIAGFGLAALLAGCVGGPHPLPPFGRDNSATPPSHEVDAGGALGAAASAGRGVPAAAGGAGGTGTTATAGTGAAAAGTGMIPGDASVGCDASAPDVDSGAACHGDEDGGVLVP